MKWLRGKSRGASGGGAEAGRRARGGWLGGLFGARKIDNLIDENFPSWEEYSAQKAREVEEAKQAEKFELPPYKVNVSSPLQRNFLYALVIGGALGLGYAVPGWAPVLIYGAIAVAFVIAMFTIVRDGIFLHIEGQRLQVDGAWINRHTHGPDKDSDANDEGGFLKSFTRKKKTIFRSRLLQIHYQNVLRAFEQGARRAWVYQDASIGEIQTLLSQGGMKLAWTVIEVLPQLGLLGTLIGLMAMFFAFRASAVAPELTLISGFGTALGTTILANLFVLILRPLYMQNERTMHEILSTLQTLMAIFILPTQQYAMERSLGRALPQLSNTPTVPIAPPALTNQGEQRIQRSLEQLAGTMREFVSLQEKVDSGTLARETAQVALEVQSALRSFQQSVNPDQLAKQQHALSQLTDSVKSLSENLSAFQKTSVKQEPQSERIEHDLTQLRVLTRDTLVLLEQIASRLNSDSRESSRNMLSLKFGVHAQVFPEEGEGHEIKTVRPEETQVAERGGAKARKPKAVQAEDVEPIEVEERPPERVAEHGPERPADRVERERAEQHEHRIERPGRAEVSSPKIRLARDRT